MNNNPVLDANLACISKYNPELKYKLMRINSLENDISFSETVLKEANLLYNGFPLHNNYGAEAEAKEIFSKLENNSLQMHVIYGFGLGYLVKHFAENSLGKVFVYEPNIEILAAVLEVVDFTEDFSKNNVFIFNDFDVLKKVYIANCPYNANTSIIFLPSYKKLFGEELTLFANKFNLVMGSVVINNNYLKHQLSPAVKMLCKNLDSLIKEPYLGLYKDLYKGDETAVIVSAGPTLDRDVEILKKYRDRAIIFSVGQALKTLMNNGITPDFVGLVEANNQMSQIEGLDVSDIDLIIEPIAYSELHKTDFKHIISYPSHTSVPNLIWTNFANIDASDYVSSGTVSYTVLYSAKILGFKNIVLVGQDLAYVNGKCYSKDARYTGLRYEYDNEAGRVKVCVDDFETFANSFFDKNSTLTTEQKFNLAKMRLDSINRNLYFVKGIEGQMVPTTNDYASFVEQIADFAKKFKNDLNLYNTSLCGAKIEGFEDISLEDALKNRNIATRKELKTDFSYNVPNILNNINHEIEVVSNILKLLKTANTLIERCENILKGNNILSIPFMEIFKQIFVIYLDLSDTYCKNGKIFSFLHKAYSLELDNCMKTCNNSNPESIKAVYEKLKAYISMVSADLNEIQSVLKSKVTVIDEMLNSKG